ncbi:MAG: hypothetical protein AB7N99_00585 [Simkaniaceae bacterium]
MSEAIFFPRPNGDEKETQNWYELATKEFAKMERFLSKEVGKGKVKDNLHDQLIWLRRQISYYLESHDLEMLEENFNWVVSNFNHDLNLTKEKQFKPMQKLSRRL